MGRTRRAPGEPTVIKKYANRRLYDTGRSSYVTLADLCEMVKEGHDFVVIDAQSGKDITRSVLTQIIADQEADAENLLPIGFLKNLIGFYGENLNDFLPKYLENTLEIFVKNQEQVQQQFSQSLGGMGKMPNMFPGASFLEEINRQNMAMLERTMKMFTDLGSAASSNNKKGS